MVVSRSLPQNATFHKLLDIYYFSGVSSFTSYDGLRDYYKKLAGLIIVEYKNDLEEFTKQALWKILKACKFLNIVGDSEYNKVIEMLNGKVIIHKSWSTISKAKATDIINELIEDMFKSGVSDSAKGKEFEQVLRGMSGE